MLCCIHSQRYKSTKQHLYVRNVVTMFSHVLQCSPTFCNAYNVPQDSPAGAKVLIRYEPGNSCDSPDLCNKSGPKKNRELS